MRAFIYSIRYIYYR